MMTMLELTRSYCWQGVSGLYKGLGPTVVKQGSNQAIRFFVMESLRSWYTEGRVNQPVPYYLLAFFGAVAGAASVLGNTPVDVVKTRMQGETYRNTIIFLMRMIIIINSLKSVENIEVVPQDHRGLCEADRPG